MPKLRSADSDYQAAMSKRVQKDLPDVNPVWAGEPVLTAETEAEALRQLESLGQQKWPDLKPAQQFARAFESRPDLAAKAYRRPTGHPSYNSR